MKISLIVNGVKREVETKPSARLLDLIREDLGLTGTKEGCGKGECGACTVLLNGELVASCLVPAPQAAGAEVLTIEGLGSSAEIHPIQEAFVEAGAVQCGYCIPGMIIASKKLLDDNPHPDIDAIKKGLSGNICRCTGYSKIFTAVQSASEKIAGKGEE